MPEDSENRSRRQAYGQLAFSPQASREACRLWAPLCLDSNKLRSSRLRGRLSYIACHRGKALRPASARQMPLSSLMADEDDGLC